MRPGLPHIEPPRRRGAHGFAAALFEGLVAAGVGRVCVCPGSRSTPLALAAASTEGLEGFVHFDERSAGFLALGLARASRRPVVLVCTSGTAAANFAPAVIESHHARVPLIVLSADRPPELRDWAAPQTIDQTRLFGDALRWFAEAPCPGLDAREGYARALGARAAATAAGSPPGPVHLNLPFREPLAPELSVGTSARAGHAVDPNAQDPGTVDGDAAHGAPDLENGPPRVLAGARIPAASVLEDLARELAAARRPLLVCGPMDADASLRDAVTAFAHLRGWPVLADGASGLRAGSAASGPPVLARGHSLLADEDFAARQAPDLVVRLGPPPTSKPFGPWLDRHPGARHWVVDPHAGFADPGQRASVHVHSEPAALLEAWIASDGGVDPTWAASWAAAEAAADHAIRTALGKETTLGHPGIVATLAEALPEGALLFASNSLPVRAVDGFLAPPRPLRVLANRGANGIDGILSSALGAAAAHGRPAALLVGDLAFLHDAGALALAARLTLDCTIVAVNNDGGGIFDQLPIAERGEAVAFEALFATPHGRSLAAVAQGFGVAAERVDTRAGFEAGLERALAAGGVQVLEVCIDRRSDLAARRRIQAEVSSALRGLAP